MDPTEIKYFIESALLAGGRPLSVDQLHALFDQRSAPEKSQIREAVAELNRDYGPRGIEVADVASGYRMQVKASMAERLQKLWEERPPRYSRALFETLALIAYRQPMTRGEIEEVRGVSVSSNIIRSLLEREWIRVVGHRDVPGRPALFGTTRLFLDYFGLKKLEDMPPLADLSDWESLRVQLNLPDVDTDELPPDSADVTELPVLQAVPSGSVVPSPASVSADGNPSDQVVEDDVPVLTDEAGVPDAADEDDDGFEEIVATKWPDPSAVLPLAAGGDEDANDVDAEATGG
jgi:segregation and condensation protein B